MAFFKSLKNELVQFCSKTSIQGMSNVVDTQQGIFFRFLWFLVVITSIICAGICLKENVSGNWKLINDFTLRLDCNRSLGFNDF